MDYADQLIIESRNNVNHKADYTHKCRCWGKCWEEYQKAIPMSIKSFKKLYGAEELKKVTTEYPDPDSDICSSCSNFNLGCYHEKTCPQQVKDGHVTKVYYGPWRNFNVIETGIWTTITCPVCGYSEIWAVGDGDARF